MEEEERRNKIALIIRELRKLRKLTQEDLSQIIMTDRSNIANYEGGKRLPSIDSLIKIAEYFNVSLDYLILGKKDSLISNAKNVDLELMAENTAIMEMELQLIEVISKKDKEIHTLKKYIDALKGYNKHLEEKLKRS